MSRGGRKKARKLRRLANEHGLTLIANPGLFNDQILVEQGSSLIQEAIYKHMVEMLHADVPPPPLKALGLKVFLVGETDA